LGVCTCVQTSLHCVFAGMRSHACVYPPAGLQIASLPPSLSLSLPHAHTQSQTPAHFHPCTQTRTSCTLTHCCAHTDTHTHATHAHSHYTRTRARVLHLHCRWPAAGGPKPACRVRRGRRAAQHQAYHQADLWGQAGPAGHHDRCLLKVSPAQPHSLCVRMLARCVPVCSLVRACHAASLMRAGGERAHSMALSIRLLCRPCPKTGPSGDGWCHVVRL